MLYERPMSFLFKHRPRAEIVSSLRQSLLRLNGTDRKKSNEDISKYLAAIKTFLCSEGNESNSDVIAQISQEIYSMDLLLLLVNNLSKLEFESKKDVVQIFNNLLWRQIGTRYPTVEYISSHPEILEALVNGYEEQDIALNCGMILRECIPHVLLAKCLLYSKCFWNFFKYVELQAFDVASDAFATFKDLLTKHTQSSVEFLQKNYDEFFSRYRGLLLSQNYVTKRQSLKLLGELLLYRSSFVVMIKYIGDAENLKLIMNLLRDDSRNIRFEAFQVFKVFIVNPNKTKPVLYILQKNKTKLISFLRTFHGDTSDDGQFNEEKLFLIKNLVAL